MFFFFYFSSLAKRSFDAVYDYDEPDLVGSSNKKRLFAKRSFDAVESSIDYDEPDLVGSSNKKRLSRSTSRRYVIPFKGNSAQQTKIYFNLFKCGVMALYFPKGCANGKCGWVKDPMRAIRKGLEQGQHRSESDITYKLDVFDVLGLRNTCVTYEETKMVQYSNGSFPFPALIHVHPRDLPITECYAEEYCMKVISIFKEDFNYDIGYGGSIVDETGEAFNALDSMFLTIDAAKLCCRLYAKDIEDEVLDQHPDVVRTFLSKHPNPMSLLRAQLKLMKK